MTTLRNPKTPTMTLPVVKHASLEEIDAFCKRASRLTLSQVVDFDQVKETIVMLKGTHQCNYTVALELFPCDQEEYHVKPSEVLKTIGSSFGVTLTREIRAKLKRRCLDLKSMVSEIGNGIVSRDKEVSCGGAMEGPDNTEEATKEGHSEVGSDFLNEQRGSQSEIDEMEYESGDDKFDHERERDVSEDVLEIEEEEEAEKDEKDDTHRKDQLWPIHQRKMMDPPNFCLWTRV